MSVYDDIKSRIDIVDLVSSYSNIQLKRAGASYKGLCPFHNEKSPSFNVNPTRQTYHCFGCHEHGDIFEFYEKIEGASKKETLIALAQQAGVTLPPPKVQKQGQETRQKLLGVLSTLNSWYQANLGGTAGDPCRSYLQARGITAETITAWGIGYAPGGWHTAYDYLVQLGYEPEILLAAGVIKEGEKGGYYDVFRDRLMIPILDPDGNVISFAGRRMNPKDEPKYLNGATTAIFEKSGVLFGFHQARRSIVASKTAIVFEGYMDVITAHQQGFTNTIGSMGVALTENHARQLNRVASQVVICFDPDKAGRDAILRALPTLQSATADCDLFVLPLPDERDPDELILESPDVWRELIAKPIPAIPHVIRSFAGDLTGATFAARKATASKLIPILMGAGTDLERLENLRLLAEYCRLDFESLRTVAYKPAPQVPAKSTNAPEIQLERDYLIGIISKPGIYALTQRVCKALKIGTLKPSDLTSPLYRALFTGLIAAGEQLELSDSEYLQENYPVPVHELYEELATLDNPFKEDTDGIRAGLHLRKATFSRLMIELQGDSDQDDFYQNVIRVYCLVSRGLQVAIS